ncbi:hypothetical protein [Myroides sp. DW712]|uniref:hypothetical protein n=1 Tax=Myroides sp. DW712 TaxID=3389800 RepID=UPI00397B0860
MTNNKFLKYWITVLVVVCYLPLFGQSVVSFTPRTSQKAPVPYKGVSTYNVQGDFVMLGNTNLTLKSYRADRNNNSNNMIVVDEDQDSSTYNSSMAELKLGAAEPTCSEILYAGLYWTGRAQNSGNNADYIVFNKKNYYKNKVKFKKEGNSYHEVSAGNEVAYPGSGNAYIYVGYADVTDYVRANGVGNYWVADIALSEGSNGTGYFGGWGLVVVYKNATMKWKDITVFDGYSYISANGGRQELNLSGFRAAQNGAVNVKMGMMAGEGDVSTTGDYFEIQKRTSNNYLKLSHAGNTANNFFNSSIFTGGNNRSPILVNNTGIDISMFNLPNEGNELINNNQTSTKFRYGTNGDLYSIFSIVFAVDAYVPEIVGENKATNYGGVKPSHNGTIEPGQEFEFELDVYNKGTEAVKDTKIEIPVPYNLHYSGANVEANLPRGGTVTWRPPAGAPVGATEQNTAGGTIVWTIGDLPLDTTKEKLLARLKYRFRVSDNCILLSTNYCGLEVRINGKISGTGLTSGTKVSSDLVKDYGSGVCAGPVYDDFMSTITLTTDFLQSCNPPVEDGIMQFKEFCQLPGNGTQYPRTKIESKYPFGTKFFSTIPSSYSSTAGVVTNDFDVNPDGSKKMFYVMTPGMGAGCYARLEISVDKVVTEPTAKNVTVCLGEPIVLENALSQTGVTNQYALVYFDANGTTQLEGEPNPTTVGVHNYFVAEGKDGCVGPKKPFTITINALPVINGEVADMEICSNFDVTTTVQTTGSGLSYTWEYSTTGTTWQTLTNATFSNKVVVTGNTIAVKHADNQLNGTKLRLKVSNNTCTATSNVFEIKVKDCPAVTNPMLLNSAIQ